jgi:ParB-like chromosome segregation protein Spo0J
MSDPLAVLPIPTDDAIPAVPLKDRLYRCSLDRVTIIGHDTTHKEGEHALWDERIRYPLNEEQVQSFMAIGIRVPIVCVVDEQGRYLVVDGRRRVIEGREAQRRLGEPIEVWVHFGGKRLSTEMQLLISVELNERRTEDPVEVKARKAGRLHALGIDIATIARAFGKTVRAVNDWLALDKAPADVKAALELGMISPAVATTLAYAKEEAPAKLDELLETGRPTRLRAAALTRGTKAAGLPKRAVRAVLKAPEGTYSADFIQGILFGRGELSKDDVGAIMAKLPPPPLPKKAKAP